MINVYVITGGPGFGKTSVLNELRDRGYNASKELSREFIQEQMKSAGTLLPWVDRLGYSEEMLKRRIRQYKDTIFSELWFFDRGIPDLIAYIIKDGLSVPSIYYEAAKEYRYQQLIFLTPPWEDIYINDQERHESFEEAAMIHREVERAYIEAGYTCITLPKFSITERVEFILKTIQQS